MLVSELPILPYEDAPDSSPPARIEANKSDVVLVTNFYGMRSHVHIDTDAVVLEDHTHDPLSPWAFSSSADYAVASLRKTLPLPDGGVLWSPKDMGLPYERPATDAHVRATLDRLSAMVLKLQYLRGASVDKAGFRALFVAGERTLGAGEISGISPFSRARLPSLPARRWSMARADNLRAFQHEIGDVFQFRVLEAPFAITLLFDSPGLRQRVRTALMANRVYPAVLWSLEAPVATGIPARHIDFSRRLLSLHCDFRYSHRDMARVAALVRETMLGPGAAI